MDWSKMRVLVVHNNLQCLPVSHTGSFEIACVIDHLT